MDDKTIRTIQISKEVSFWANIANDKLDKFKYPTRVGAGVFIVIFNGYCNLSVDLSNYSVNKSSVVTLLANSIIQITDYSNDFDAYYIVFPSEFVRNINLIQSALPFLTEIKNNPILELEETSKTLMLEFCVVFRKIYEKQKEKPIPEIIESLLMSMLWGIATAYKARSIIKDKEVYTSHKVELYRKLLPLIIENYKTDRAISFYADKLCVSPKYLSAIIKDVSGKKMSELISEVVILDIKSQLKNTDETISQISDSLNFPNPSFFCKYFKKHTGMTPKDYRYSD
ncbi:helix-turn-helix domain-containing protein [Bacteroides sp.]|uniref:AraC family transcriptional regulator n=1 Tax=Bacteroides sp. TaxID=29523 RepID=UPI001B6C9B14|nr:helix-turn-helix domain-containing protein [Bacteroides sp.]MBP6065827.1 AraC family transcriptional regulator [Bacteroides sp.]MBP6066933.1 AraC family transcriptional regulator [Bacteroides sp.]MBP6936606.1 AraC family transcriptional regulator [Bacteroides sp.]MBP9585526.1 AraC family transcriptional regulator [Bacteroides sp.]